MKLDTRSSMAFYYALPYALYLHYPSAGAVNLKFSLREHEELPVTSCLELPWLHVVFS